MTRGEEGKEEEEKGKEKEEEGKKRDHRFLPQPREVLKVQGTGGRAGTTPELAAGGIMASRNPPPQDYESDDDSYEVLDLTEYARRHHWWNRVFGHRSGPMVEKYSVATQIAIGGVTGWCAGFLFQKVGKLAATAVGGGFLLLQATEFIKQNIVISSGFVGGFLLGLAS
ncbi:FUN14 domain-containing protein 1 isoform X2 [Fukomys damarensis]|uniref:FUN14 domain-containing protein 1 isoform X2 n=1 Tax=Fukomys damarensis TaxID=885580 RepID=UPI0008FF6F93|nr:FUN14 domain-containing protein 1 isoform X2 [Fukomys damarensis]